MDTTMFIIFAAFVAIFGGNEIAKSNKKNKKK